MNPNLEAQLTTGQTGTTTSGTGTSGPGVLTINPISVRIAPNESMLFTAAGGEPPYVFSLVTSGNGTITPQGLYTAGSVGGVTDRVRVTDASNTFYDADVFIYDPASEPNPYRIVCTDLTPPAPAIVVPPGTLVNFRIENGTPPDSFNVTNMSGGRPQGFLPAARVGAWYIPSLLQDPNVQSADDGSVVDTLQVFDSSNPLNVAVLKIYVCATALQVTPAWAVVPTTIQKQFLATSTGVGTLTWSLPAGSNQSGGSVSPLIGTSTTYYPGSNTRGVFGATDVVQVEDSFPNPPQSGIPHQIAQAKVTVPGLSVNPTEAHLRPGGTKVFTALGGAAPYSWSLFQNRSGSSTQSGMGQTFNFQAGGGEGEDILELQDNAGGLIRVKITVCTAITSWNYLRVTTYFPTTGRIGDYIPLDMVVDDFNGDGSPDVALPFSSSARTVFSNRTGNQVAVLLGSGPGNFTASSTKYTLAGAVGVWGICSGDFNADGNRDLAVSSYTSSSVIVMFGDGTGAFPDTGVLSYYTLTLTNGMGPTGIRAYNFDRASGDDIVVADGLNGQVAVLLSRGGGANNAFGGFQVVANLTVPDPVTTDTIFPMCLDVAVANFDNDSTGGAINRTGNSPDGVGLVDIAVTDYSHDRIVVFKADDIASWGGGAFPTPVWSGGGQGADRLPVGIDVGYFGGTTDTFPDIVVANNGKRDQNNPNLGVSILNNTGAVGTPSFAAAVEYGYSYYRTCYYWDVEAYDLDNDGWDDVAATARNIRPDLGLGNGATDGFYGGLVVWRGLGNGSLNGWTTGTTTTGTRYYPSHQYWLPTAVKVIDFGGMTHGNPGAPLPDLILCNGTWGTNYPYYGKLVVYENQCN
ncbi:MAG: FG-GAP repeat domain-containing protein [Planctomycetota bacterium]